MSSWALEIILRHGLGDKALASGQSPFTTDFNVEEACRELDAAYEAAAKERDEALAELAKAKEDWKYMYAQKDLYREAQEQVIVERARAQKLVEAAQSIMWINKCHCDEAFTARRKHEPNTICGELDVLADALAEYEKEGGL